MEQIKIIQELIANNKRQTEILEKQLKKLRDGLPSLTIYIDNEKLIYKTSYADKYNNKQIDLPKSYLHTTRKEIFDVVFSQDTTCNSYNVIYGNQCYDYKDAYYALSTLRKIYDSAIIYDERYRIKTIYNIVLAKHMFVANFINSEALTKQIIDDFVGFYKLDCICLDGKPDINTQLSILSYLVDNNLPHKELHIKLIELVKTWLCNKFACMYIL